MAKKPAKSPIRVIRDPKVISDDYASTCAKAGETQFKIKVLESEMFNLNKRLIEINAEHHEAMANMQKKAQKEETSAQDSE